MIGGIIITIIMLFIVIRSSKGERQAWTVSFCPRRDIFESSPVTFAGLCFRGSAVGRT